MYLNKEQGQGQVKRDIRPEKTEWEQMHEIYGGKKLEAPIYFQILI
jgi:hypothetical protein